MRIVAFNRKSIWMREIVQNVYLIEGLRISNVYLLVSEAKLALVDTGLAGDVNRIIAQIEEEGYSLTELHSIILTHAHSDHVGGAAKLLRRCDAEVVAHRVEVPYIEGSQRLPAGSMLQKMVTWLGGRIPRKGQGIKVARGLENGEVLDILGGLKVLHTSGHTPGSICLYQEEKRILFCGDLLFNGHPMTGRGGLRYAPRMFSVDPEEAEKSARGLSELAVEVLCVGHGEPIVKDTGARMEALFGNVSP
jgi:glyoxylase-like metal-dependent hydrolase (beta-lactamase superfamily II)